MAKESTFDYKHIHSLTLPTTVLYPYGLSWSRDNNIAAVTLKGIYVMSVVPDPRAQGKVINLVQECIETPTEVNPHHDLAIDAKLVKRQVSRTGMHEIILDRAFGALRYSDEPVLSVYKNVAWSPPGIGMWPSKNSCVLAALGVDFRLVLFHHQKSSWTPCCDVSKLWKDRCHSNWLPEKIDEPIPFSQIQARAHLLATIDFGWSQVVNEKAFLLTLQRNGQINVWKVFSLQVTASENVEFYGSFESKLDQACTLHISHDLVFVGSTGGLVRCFKIANESQTLKVEDLGFVQEIYDGLTVDKLVFCQIERENILLAIKGSCLLAYKFGMNPKIETVSHVGAFIEGLRCTGLSETKEPGKFLLVTEDHQLHEVSVNCKSEEMRLNVTSVGINRNESMGCKGIVQAPNSHLICALETLKVPYDHLSIRDPTSVSFYSSTSLTYTLETLIEADSEDMGQQTASLELFRALAINNPEEPYELGLGLHSLKELSVYFLKLARWLLLLRLSHNPDLSELVDNVNAVEVEILLRHVRRVWEQLRTQNMEDYSLSTLVALIQFSQQNQIETGLPNQGGLINHHKETCPICAAGLTNAFSDACPNGHAFPRCAESLRICSFRPRRCLHCKAFYHQDRGNNFMSKI